MSNLITFHPSCSTVLCRFSPLRFLVCYVVFYYYISFVIYRDSIHYLKEYYTKYYIFIYNISSNMQFKTRSISYGFISYLLCSLHDFWTFHNKSHNMKPLAILGHSWSPFLPLTCLYGKIYGLLGYFREKKLPPDYSCKSHGHDHWWADLYHGLITVRQKKMWT